MLRKLIVAIAVVLMLGGSMLIPTDASARGGRGGGHGGHGFHGHGFHGGHVAFRGARFISAAPLYVGCWRWVPSRWGLVRVWVC